MANVVYEAHKGETPFISACIDGELETAKALFKQGGVDLNARTAGGTTVLEELVFKTAGAPKDFVITKHKGRQVHITDPDRIREILGSHPDDDLRKAVETALFVLESGADPDCSNENGQTAAFTAAGENTAWMITLLGANGANLSRSDNWGLSALHYAARAGNAEAAEALLAAGANPDVQDEFGFTAAFEAASARNLNILKLLAEHGADFSLGLTRAFKTNQAGTTPQAYAESHGFEEIVNFLKAERKSKDCIAGKTFPPSYTWDQTDKGHMGVKVEDGKLLWYTHTEYTLDPGMGACTQEFHDFIENGPRVSQVPENTVLLVKAWILQ